MSRHTATGPLANARLLKNELRAGHVRFGAPVAGSRRFAAIAFQVEVRANSQDVHPFGSDGDINVDT